MTGQTVIQIGAGAGDRDARADHRDGFTELIKKGPAASYSRIILVEPNPVNIPELMCAWKDYPQAEIHQIGIRPRSVPMDTLTFYFAEEDAPHFQVTSMDPYHVLKHYREGTLKAMQVETKTLEDFLFDVSPGSPIALLALHIEGIDGQILLETDWSRLPIGLLSFEHLHLGDDLPRVKKHLEACGYRHAGRGVDVNGYDLLYEGPLARQG